MNEFSDSASSRQYNRDAAQVDFLEQYQSIVNKKLDARRIDSYADDALVGLISLVKSALETSDVDESFNRQTQERQALQDVGLELETIETTLDHIARVADSIHLLDDLIENKTIFTGSVILPPDQIETIIAHGDGSEWSKEAIPKLKTLLLLLQEKFNVDLESSDVSILDGALRSSMMREQSYKLVDIKSLERTVLICDEHGNTTFVLNRAKCDEYGMRIDDFAGLTKAELKAYLTNDPGLGARIDYSDDYVDNLTMTLTGGSENIKIGDNTNGRPAPNTLRPKVDMAPEGYLTTRRMSIEYERTSTHLNNVIDCLSDELGTVLIARTQNKTTRVFSPRQQEIIKNYIGRNYEEEGFVAAKSLQRSLGVSQNALKGAINAVSADFGDTVTGIRRGGRTTLYSPDQQQMIEGALKNRGVFADSPKEGYVSIHDMSRLWNVSHGVVQRAVKVLENEIGEVLEAKFGTTTAGTYSPEQQEMIRHNLESRGLFASSPDEEYLSANGIADSLEVSAEVVRRAIKQVNGHLGYVSKAKFKSVIANAYSPEQQEIIIDYIKKNSRAKSIGRQATYRAEADK